MRLDDIEQLLKNLGLRRIAELLPDELAKAKKRNLSYEALLQRLLRAQWQAKQESALNYRIKRADIPESLMLETFPFKKQPGVSKRQVMSLAELDFIPRHENITFIGPTAVGKSGLATGLLMKALHNGYRGRFISAQDLFDEMYASLADRSTRKLLNHLTRVDVLVIDEMGYLNVKPEQTNIFFKLLGERYRRRPTIITTNLEYDDWAQFLGNKPLTEALLSRFRHHCHTIRIEGPPLRVPQS
jgi:DNA replication protein DnaC